MVAMWHTLETQVCPHPGHKSGLHTVERMEGIKGQGMGGQRTGPASPYAGIRQTGTIKPAETVRSTQSQVAGGWAGLAAHSLIQCRQPRQGRGDS